MYDLGKLLQTPDSLTVFSGNFRPWPHIYQNRGRSKKFYTAMDRNLTRDLTALRTYDNRADNVKYTNLLRTILKLFGEGIIDSLEYTLHKYLYQTDGALCNAQREPWEEEAAAGMLRHNNNAERPFAVVRSYKRMYPAVSIRNLSRLSQTLVSGSHTPAEKGHLAGVTLTADPRLKTCIGTLCGVRKVKIGIITQMLRAAHTLDTREMIATWKRRAVEKYQENVRKKSKEGRFSGSRGGSNC